MPPRWTEVVAVGPPRTWNELVHFVRPLLRRDHHGREQVVPLHFPLHNRRLTAERMTKTLREAYASAMLAKAGVTDRALEAAMAKVPREDFLGDPPWLAREWGQEQSVSTIDPADIYRDVLVVLDGEKGLNNGSPSLHAAGLHALGPRPGDTVVHIGEDRLLQRHPGRTGWSGRICRRRGV